VAALLDVTTFLDMALLDVVYRSVHIALDGAVVMAEQALSGAKQPGALHVVAVVTLLDVHGSLLDVDRGPLDVVVLLHVNGSLLHVHGGLLHVAGRFLYGALLDVAVRLLYGALLHLAASPATQQLEGMCLALTQTRQADNQQRRQHHAGSHLGDSFERVSEYGTHI
jgi:hypothetical protein